MTSRKPTTLFWVLGALFLMWNIFGSGGYVFSRYSADETFLAMKEVSPIWATATYALAVWSGLLAAIMYLLRKKLAVPLFIFSLVTAIICFIPTFTMAEIKALSGPNYWAMPIIVVLLGIFEVVWTRKKTADGMLT